jgi:hypothetical protein
MKRRTLLAASVGSTALLLAGGAWFGLRQGAPAREAIHTADASALLNALVPIVVGHTLTPTQNAATVQRVKDAVASLPLSTQDEIGELFALLSNSVFRRLAAGVSTPWNQATPAELAAFLQGWRTHSLGLLQVGYHALHDVITGSFYADQSTWALIGYSGPIQLPA